MTATMTMREFLNKKYYEMQAQKGGKIKIDEFAKLFGAPQSLMSMWLNGERIPGPKYKKLIIERYGNEAIEAFGEDPDLYALQSNWEFMNVEDRRALREQSEKLKLKNESERAPGKRRIRKTA
jgi:hypothetical protein